MNKHCYFRLCRLLGYGMMDEKILSRYYLHKEKKTLDDWYNIFRLNELKYLSKMRIKYGNIWL